jgi:hypothetical protein
VSTTTVYYWTIRDRKGFSVGFGLSLCCGAMKAREDLELEDGFYVDNVNAVTGEITDKLKEKCRVGKSVKALPPPPDRNYHG